MLNVVVLQVKFFEVDQIQQLAQLNVIVRDI